MFWRRNVANTCKFWTVYLLVDLNISLFIEYLFIFWNANE